MTRFYALVERDLHVCRVDEDGAMHPVEPKDWPEEVQKAVDRHTYGLTLVPIDGSGPGTPGSGGCTLDNPELQEEMRQLGGKLHFAGRRIQ